MPPYDVALYPSHVSVASGRIQSRRSAAASRLTIDGRDVLLPAGAIIVPGFVDTHCHLIGLGLMRSRVALRGARTAGECASRVAERVRHAERGTWIVGFGWNQEEWLEKHMPHRELLDAVAPDNPVALYRIDSHASWCNTRALEVAGLMHDRSVEDAGGDQAIERDVNGVPTGILIDHAMKFVDCRMPPPTVDQQAGWIAESVEEALRLGITEIHDMNVEPQRLEAMTRVAEGGAMRLRCQVFLQGENEAWRAIPSPVTLAPNLHIVGVKYFADGALGSRGAWLLEPYADAPGTCGIPLLPGIADVVEEMAAPLAQGYAVATHAIGDAANRFVLDAYTQLRARFGDALLRIEHAQIVHPDDQPRFAEAQVIPTMQAVHCTSDAAMADARLGPARALYAYPWRALRDLGVPLLGGSDFPIESPDPLEGLRAFVFREPLAGGGAWHGAQAITRAEALAAYTTWAPLAVRGAERRGALEPGFDADLVVLSGDPFDDPDAKVLMTIVAGEVAFRSQ